ncbi:MAG: phage tail protein [Plesiomonas sp.]|uniref:phage tail protein n=1 Tax=Plesiomonas sp. TaxID=2486279 RepID=UPI003F3C5E9B
MSKYDEWLNEEFDMPAEKHQVVAPHPLVDFDDIDMPVSDEITRPEEDVVDIATSASNPTIPASIGTREQSESLKPRYSGHSPLNDLARADWMVMVQCDPDSYDAFLYRPIEANHNENSEHFTELNNHQKELTYSDPEIVKVLDCPDERESFTAVDSDGDQDGVVDDFLIIRAATTEVSIGSIFEWNEELLDGELARRWWYVLQIYTYGTTSIGSLYYCVPARNISQSAGGNANG